MKNYHELKEKLLEGMTTGIFNYGFDFQIDVVDGEEEGEEDDEQQQNLRNRKSFMTDKWKSHKFDRHEHHWERHEMLPWEIENAVNANERRELVFRWLKAASANNLQAITNNSLPSVPDWQKVKFKS